MSAQEVRNEIISENLPMLLKELTGFENDDENMRQCEQFAWYIIRNHRNLSTNSHEVKRKIRGIQEKFVVDNFQEYADHFGILCDEIVKHPLCMEHYEIDVHWSLLDFLLTLAYNPTVALKKNNYKINLPSKQVSVEPNRIDESECIQLLKENFIPLPSNMSIDDSELSDWSNDDDDGVAEPNVCRYKDINLDAKSKLISNLPGIQPPQKQKHYKTFDNSKSQMTLLQTVQNTWWLPCAKHFQTQVRSERMEANFSSLYSNFLIETSNNLIHFKEPSTTPELCLLREILWMFHSPHDCKFFRIHVNDEIQICDNVSIPSLSVNGLKNYLEHNFLPYIRMMAKIRSFFDIVYSDFNLPKTLECYAANLRCLLIPIWADLLNYEQRLLEQNDFEINSLLNLQQSLKKTFTILQTIYEIHSRAVLNYNQYPAHISSAYLLSSLMCSNTIASSGIEANLSVSLFLTSIKIFCIIIDTWWTEGRLDDWQEEFLVECVSTNTFDQKIYIRQFCKDKEKAFFVPTSISKAITENNCLRLLLDHSLEASCTLNLLYQINRIGDLKNTSEVIEGKLYDVFIEEVLKHIETLQSEVIFDTKTNSNNQLNIKNNTKEECTSHDILCCLTTKDEFLITAFACNIDEKSKQKARINELTAYDIWKVLGRSDNMVLPFEEVVLSSLSRILKARIAFANNYVMKLYREEFVILKHLGNIRKVLLLEASDLMHQFYANLFKNIESGQSWANPFILTMQLDDIICVKFPEMSSLFRLDINPSSVRCQTNMVIDAVEEITVRYNFSRELSLIITESDIEEYNQVFRFLLKVKWGLKTLESLEFPRAHKRRVPYAHFEMTDLLMRRLEQLRFWMIYAIQSIHFHLMTHVLQSMGEQLDEKITKCNNLKEMEMVHKSYISTVCKHCFLVDNSSNIKLGVEQLLNLAFILRLEWNSCLKYIESNHPLAIDLSDSNTDESDDYVATTQIDAIELTYIRCHQYLANWLNNEVYLKKKSYLSGLSAAFNTSLPY